MNDIQKNVGIQRNIVNCCGTNDLWIMLLTVLFTYCVWRNKMIFYLRILCMVWQILFSWDLMLIDYVIMPTVWHVIYLNKALEERTAIFQAWAFILAIKVWKYLQYFLINMCTLNTLFSVYVVAWYQSIWPTFFRVVYFTGSQAILPDCPIVIDVTLIDKGV